MTAPLCESCAMAHRTVPGEVRISWDLGYKWLCKECAGMEIPDLDERARFMSEQE